MMNNWKQAVSLNRTAVLDRWSSAGLGMFPEHMSRATPAGEALADAMGTVLDNIGGGVDCREGIERLTRIFAVQPLPPSKSLALFGALCDLIQEFIPEDAGREACRRRMDEMTLEAFDCFMENRENIYRLKVDEARSQMHMLLRRAVS
ncbi:MAG: hypothetical protein A3K90_00365 [Pelodictyon luteolum]|uniref:RsbT co-antagonist protein RsbRD N-terminal domain-containing protein n=1 Tax=Pelodictyon luteolum TaxID=1100 RepID=A0A165M987_PELLU|nr:hypothetical protein [Pelodictyon luteolum]KZK74967.1 MAG: hypothetical protein A3K90_00365 [Pelodictyon luteolum]